MSLRVHLCFIINIKALIIILPKLFTVDLPETEENSMKQLEMLLQEVTDKISVATERDADDTESLKDALDEVQTVIIKLKHDYDGAANDTLNETLEDLECSVRSVQLQINEDSPPELLKEACATLQLLVNNMSETQEVSVTEVKANEVDKANILEKCSMETDETVKLLELAFKIDVKDNNLSSIINGLTVLKDALKTLKLSFTGNAAILIERGVHITQSLDVLEDQVFTLEKELTDTSMNVDTRDSILTAIHSVYGSISNMRGTISSVQKSFMFENYGRPSEALLRSIKNVSTISENADMEKQPWKDFSKSLRKVHNHFEDIKFYINLDKTARLPSDAAFTKIILDELKFNIGQVLVPQASTLGSEATKKVNSLLDCVNKNLLSIEASVTLEVKRKIPIFKEISSQLFHVTEFIKVEMDKTINEPREEILSQQAKTLTMISTDRSTGQDENVESSEISKKPTDAAKKVKIQETNIESEIEEIALGLVTEIASEAIARIQTMEEIAYTQQQATIKSDAEITEESTELVNVLEIGDKFSSEQAKTVPETSKDQDGQEASSSMKTIKEDMVIDESVKLKDRQKDAEEIKGTVENLLESTEAEFKSVDKKEELEIMKQEERVVEQQELVQIDTEQTELTFQETEKLEREKLEAFSLQESKELEPKDISSKETETEDAERQVSADKSEDNKMESITSKKGDEVASTSDFKKVDADTKAFTGKDDVDIEKKDMEDKHSKEKDETKNEPEFYEDAKSELDSTMTESLKQIKTSADKETKATRGIDETTAASNIETEKSETKAQKDIEEVRDKVTKESEVAEVKPKKDKEVDSARVGKESEVTDAKVKKTNQDFEDKANKEYEDAKVWI